MRQMKAGELDSIIFDRQGFHGKAESRLMISLGQHGVDGRVNAADLETASAYLAQQARKLRTREALSERTPPDPYKVLGISREASPDEIKAAYHRLALQFHPDRNHGDRVVEERFKEITMAYQMLMGEEVKS